MPAHGNESEGSILVAQSNAFPCQLVRPLFLFAIELENTDIPNPGCFTPYDAQRNYTITMFDDNMKISLH